MKKCRQASKIVQKVAKALINDNHFEIELEEDLTDDEVAEKIEEYVDGDDLGTLDCGHDFHVGCVRQWLVVKNTCPICKNTALKS